MHKRDGANLFPRDRILGEQVARGMADEFLEVDNLVVEHV